MMTFAEKLRELAGKATPGPWEIKPRSITEFRLLECGADPFETAAKSIEEFLGWEIYGPAQVGRGDFNGPDCGLMVYLANNAFAIAAVVESSERVADFGTMRREEFVEKWKCVATAAYVFDQLTAALTALNRTGGDDER